MNTVVRQQLVEAAKDIQLREILTFLYRDHPQGASFEGLKEMLFLHENFEEAPLMQLAQSKILGFDGMRYKIAADARQVLDRDPTILMDEFLR
ncbi:MAG: hypothetical protein COV75_05915 [Candidatus Omnitrophica bacterium CG11_big_fil_rev_8_21_14_0_20_63_9]|nr:MAG: hypothetical protein COV75_05915 [Candidatus Omnitrophica bacterium CG11_big_fil_rev_8_21_14_0_20_63_9]